MIDIKYSGWHFNADVESTAEYYKDYDDMCDCAMCRNFYLNAPNLPLDIKEFLEQFGIDVGKPIEQWSVTADKQNKVVDNVLYYAVNGTAKFLLSLGEGEIDFGTVNIVVQSPKPDDVVKCPEYSPNTEIREPYFIFEVYNVWTPWLVPYDINVCYPDPKPKKALTIPLLIISLLFLAGAAFAGFYAVKNDSTFDTVLLFIAAGLMIFVGGIILLILIASMSKPKDKALDGFNAIWECDYDDIWKVEDRNSLVVAMNGWLCRKCNYGEEPEKLTREERIFYVNQQLEGEVNNGGFSQFFFNSSGKFANEIVDSLKAIGANKTAEICKKVLDAYKVKLPENFEEREKVLDIINFDEIDDIISECNGEFYEQPDDLELLNYQFIFKNKEQFTKA